MCFLVFLGLSKFLDCGLVGTVNRSAVIDGYLANNYVWATGVVTSVISLAKNIAASGLGKKQTLQHASP